MRLTALLLLVAIGACGQQTLAPAAPTETKGDTVVATLNGRPFTADQILAIVSVMPPAARRVFQANPREFLRDHAFYLTLVQYAEKNGIEKQAPYREMLEVSRINVLANAAVNYHLKTISVLPEDQKAYYDKHQDDFREAKVRMIAVLIERAGEDKAAAEKAAAIAKRAKAGEDFAKLAAEAGGNAEPFAVTRDSSQPPAAMKKIIFSQKEGSITDPLRHENGYYVFRVESVGIQPYEKVRDDIYKLVQDARLAEWQAKTRSQSSVQFNNEAFFQNIGKQ